MILVLTIDVSKLCDNIQSGFLQRDGNKIKYETLLAVSLLSIFNQGK